MVPPQALAVHFHGFNPDRGFMLSEKHIASRASYRIKAKNKPKKQIFSQFWGQTKAGIAWKCTCTNALCNIQIFFFRELYVIYYLVLCQAMHGLIKKIYVKNQNYINN